MARLALLLIAALAAPNYRVRAEYARCDCARQQWRLPGEQRVARAALKTRGCCGLAAAPRLRRGQAEGQIVPTNASVALRCPARCALARSPLQLRGVSLAGYAPGRSRQLTLLAPACADKEALVPFPCSLRSALGFVRIRTVAGPAHGWHKHSAPRSNGRQHRELVRLHRAEPIATPSRSAGLRTSRVPCDGCGESCPPSLGVPQQSRTSQLLPNGYKFPLSIRGSALALPLTSWHDCLPRLSNRHSRQMWHKMLITRSLSAAYPRCPAPTRYSQTCFPSAPTPPAMARPASRSQPQSRSWTHERASSTQTGVHTSTRAAVAPCTACAAAAQTVARSTARPIERPPLRRTTPQASLRRYAPPCGRPAVRCLRLRAILRSPARRCRHS